MPHQGDPCFQGVVLLLPFNGQTQLQDLRHHAQSSAGTPPTIEVDPQGFGGYSLHMTGGGCVQYAVTPDLDYGNGDFCVEGFYTSASDSGGGYLLGQIGNGPDTYTSVGIRKINDELRGFMYSGFGAGNSQVTQSGLVVGVRSHFALVRYGVSFRLYINGVGGTDVPFVDPETAATLSILPFTVGSRDGGNSGTTGSIDEVRVTIGCPRYTGDFTPPTVPFPRY